MNRSCTITIEETPPSDEVKLLYEGLREYNSSYVTDNQHRPLVVFLRDENNAIVGGLLGDTFWGWLHVSIFWIRADWRRRGLGRAMLTAAEQEAIKRGCKYAFLDTTSFQALPFYLKLGYTIFGELGDFPPGHKRYFLKKTL